MAYSAMKGGQEAIKQAEVLMEQMRCAGGSAPVAVAQLMDQMSYMVDKVMGEGALYSRELSALALKQSQGDMLEAAFTVRAFLSTLPRSHYSKVIDTAGMRAKRRISGTYKDVAGGQFLGATPDYTQRLLRFDLMDEGPIQPFSQAHRADPLAETGFPVLPKVVETLRQEGLVDPMEPYAEADMGYPPPEAVPDITRESLRFPAPRAARLQSLARGETGGLMALAYSCIRGYGDIHPYLVELRVGHVEVWMEHPLEPGLELVLGEVLVTETEMVSSIKQAGADGVHRFSLGYGLCFGHNEVKAIAMGILDRSMRAVDPATPAEDEEFVLYHVDGVESAGFTSHWKLPHYVDFKAELAIIRDIRRTHSEEA